ncbi:MAG TPA: hypothetical protein VN843_22800 [Anaerolineales bacterium]|nr:hypothetical protein [Anaerolineales bacterium]
MQRILEKPWVRKVLSIPFLIGMLTANGCGVFQRADEEWAIGGMIHIRKSEESFKAAKGRYGTLEELTSSGLAAPSREQYGYKFILLPTSSSYVALAVPTRSKNISMSLYLNQSGIIRGKHKNGEEATAEDPPLKGYGDNP